MGWAVLTAALPIFAIGCSRHHATPAPIEAGPPLGAWAGAWGGCAAVMEKEGRPVCELGASRQLRAVVGPDAVITTGAARLDVKRDGSSATFLVPDGAPSITIAVPGHAPFVLAVVPSAPLAWAEDAKAARAKGDARGARAIAEAHLADLDGRARATACGLVARIALAEGRADAAFPMFRDAIAQARKDGRISDAVDDSLALAFALHQRSFRYAEARAALDAIADLLPRYPEGAARAPYYRGILASETGDRRSALALLSEAESRARALGMIRLERNAKSALALEMQALGRARASMGILRGLEGATDAAPCERREIAINLGWGALLANDPQGARGHLERALAIEKCNDAYLESFALTNLARVTVEAGDLDEATRRLEAAKKAVAEPRGTDRMAWLDIEGHILLGRKKSAEALAKFDEARALAKAAFLLEPEWSALTSKAHALEASGRDRDALDALREAEAIVDRAMLLVPLGAGRGSFVADRSRSARAAIDLLIKTGAADEGARVARRSRTRVLASVERALRIERLTPQDRVRWEAAVHAYRTARDAIDSEAASDWKLAADALARVTAARKERETALRVALESAMAVIAESDAPPQNAAPAKGDLDLVIHPGRRTFHAFAIDADGTTTQTIPSPDGASEESLAKALLDPIAARIGKARRVRVQAYGSWRSVDVHALPFGDGPLGAKVAVDYPLGLRPRRDRGLTSGTLVVGDPRGDLPKARAEAEAVARIVKAEKSLLGAAATTPAVRDAMRGVDLLHYAGHGVFAGVEGWDSALPLADKGNLTVGDILALPSVPRRVVLAGCEAARAEGEAEGLGLAQAFLVAGADEAIAPTRPVKDEVAATLATALHPIAREETLAAAMFRATRGEGRATLAPPDFAAFRVIAR